VRNTEDVCEAKQTLAWIRFNDPGMFFENDYESGGIIRMHRPSAMFQSVLDVLRNENRSTSTLQRARPSWARRRSPLVKRNQSHRESARPRRDWGERTSTQAALSARITLGLLASRLVERDIAATKRPVPLMRRRS
jgi:hypothetical protein